MNTLQRYAKYTVLVAIVTVMFMTTLGFAEEVTLTTIMPSQDTLRVKRGAVGDYDINGDGDTEDTITVDGEVYKEWSYKDIPVTDPDDGSPFIGDNNLLVSGRVGLGTSGVPAIPFLHIGYPTYLTQQHFAVVNGYSMRGVSLGGTGTDSEVGRIDAYSYKPDGTTYWDTVDVPLVLQGHKSRTVKANVIVGMPVIFLGFNKDNYADDLSKVWQPAKLNVHSYGSGAVISAVDIKRTQKPSLEILTGPIGVPILEKCIILKPGKVIDYRDGREWGGLGLAITSKNGVPGVFVERELGTVGIGTATPNNAYKMHVEGKLYAKEFWNLAGKFADYVFEPDYKLESIEDHSKYMFENKHLKAIPKAELDENGQKVVEIGSQTTGILEELEKAHIYIKQLNERIKKLEAKNRDSNL